MMIEPIHSISILAAGEGIDSAIEVILFIVIAAGSVIAAVVKKSAEKRQQEEAQRKAQEAKEILARRAQREQAQRTGESHTGGFRQATSKSTSLRDFIRSQDATPPKPYAKPSMFNAPPKPVYPVEAEHHLVDLTPIQHLPPEDELIPDVLPSELEHRSRRTKKTVADFIRKGQTSPSPIAATVGSDAKEDMSNLSESAESSKRTHVNLLDAKTARAAIIFHEILSPPKALRDEPELWE